MASSGSAGRDVPAARAAAAVNDLIEAREGATRLKGMLQEQSSELTELMDGMLNKLSSALSALDTGCTAGASASGSADGVIRARAESSTGRTRKRSFSRRLEGFSGKRDTDTLVDGHIWRKYGQKEIQNSTHPRSYYRRPRLQRQEASPDLRDPSNQVRHHVLRRAHLQASLQYPNDHCRCERRPCRKPRQFCPDVSSFGPGHYSAVLLVVHQR
uniref:WRKY domain-containing protein n=1 Tax=Triticum urartu TaxID=4572 RepID=A0A8R7U5M0_TRIUA